MIKRIHPFTPRTDGVRATRVKEKGPAFDREIESSITTLLVKCML
jgi:hypothetical protein